jgi:hypothetical protein
MLCEGLDPRDCATKDESVNIEGAFVCIGDLQIGDMSTYMIPGIMTV